MPLTESPTHWYLRQPWQCSEGVLPLPPTIRTLSTVCPHLVLKQEPSTSQPTPLLTELLPTFLIALSVLQIKTNQQHHHGSSAEWFSSAQILHINNIFELKSFSILEIALWRHLITARAAVGQTGEGKKATSSEGSISDTYGRPFELWSPLLEDPAWRGQGGWVSVSSWLSPAMMSSPSAFSVTHNL